MPQFAARPSGYIYASGAKIQNYCDSPDPYCCTGSDQAVHQGYGTKYGQQALAFVKTKLNASSGGTPGLSPFQRRPNRRLGSVCPSCRNRIG